VRHGELTYPTFQHGDATSIDDQARRYRTEIEAIYLSGDFAVDVHPAEWPTVQRRVLENQESLRQGARDYGVSHETVRRVLLAGCKKDIG